MGATALGTALRKFFCQCVLEDGSEVFIAMKAYSEAQATELVHGGYAVEYVLDVLSSLQMEYRKRHLRKSLLQTVSNV